ncbi:hypothetical protein E1B28_013330 [Marasmius oreades]|uniref:LysM domain-containing protein n=1 Tax=Marasmius oreades TaxID=181124 RepID=A0A9P7RPN2_9AGAR|nr:uncharacterized protein E1B28_013330 [Marasmius oreades]KAG7087357.1 hypothetical protein E1B28_013330 [Marasmius oreades]
MSLLCLACSSCLPSRSAEQKLFMTPCCQHPICNPCISSNPRLARYNPCLMCLAGVDAVGANINGKGNESQTAVRNIDGAVHDEDIFVLGDDDEENDDFQSLEIDGRSHILAAASSNASEVVCGNSSPQRDIQAEQEIHTKMDNQTTRRQAQYHIKRGDTLQGIVFKFGVNPEELCRLNKLPFSTLTTTPHLVHTRTVLLLPPSARIVNKDNVSFLDESVSSSSKIEEERAR